MAGIKTIRLVTKFLLIAVLSVAGQFLYPASPVAALSVSDYFTISYSIMINKSEISDTDTFSAIASGSAVCINKLPVTITSATITSRIIARNITTGAEITLNPGFSIKIDPFPSDIGASTELTEEITLAFPEGSPSGTYSIVGELVQAKVRAVITIDVTGYLPESSEVGTVHFTASESPSSTTGTTATVTQTSTAASTTTTTSIATPSEQVTTSAEPTTTSPDIKIENPALSTTAAASSTNAAVEPGSIVSSPESPITSPDIQRVAATGTSSTVTAAQGTFAIGYWWLAVVILGAAAAGIGAGLLMRHILRRKNKF